LPRSRCEIIASYVLPISVYSFDDEQKIDEVFRRINSNGKYLSRQELRAAGATGYFPDLVRKLSSEIRTDASASDVLPLNRMKVISITNKELDYGIRIDDVFWVKNNILTKEMVRESKDEEVIADLISYIALPEALLSSSDALDKFYGLKKSTRKEEIEIAIQKNNPEKIRLQFLRVYDQIRYTLDESGEKFNQLILDQNAQKVPRYFQAVFLSFYDLMFKEQMEVANSPKLIGSLKNIGSHINITTGGNWSAANKTKNIGAVKGIIASSFKKKDSIDPATDSWLTEFETLLTQSRTEQNLYDFKQGFTRLDGVGEFDKESFNKIIKTLTAIANYGPKAKGYICVGVTDRLADSQKVKELHNIDSIVYRNFHITGIGHEASRIKGSLDAFFKWLIQEIQNQPIEQSVKDRISSEVRIISYSEKDVVIFSIQVARDPIMYDGNYYQRLGSNVDQVDSRSFPEFFRKFS